MQFNKSWRLIWPWLAWYLLLPLLWVIAFIPMRWRWQLAKMIAFFWWRLPLEKQKTSVINILLCFPQKTSKRHWAIYRRYWQWQWFALLDYAPRWFRSKFWLKQRTVWPAPALKPPTLFLGIHSVSPDLAPNLLCQYLPLAGPYKAFDFQPLEQQMRQGRLRFCQQGRVFPRQGALRAMLEAIKEDFFLYYIGDEDLKEGNSQFLPFFDVPKATLTLPLRLSMKYQVQIVPCLALAEPRSGYYFLYFSKPLDENAKVQDLALAIEQLVRRFPARYMWSLRFFRQRPNGEKKIYNNKRLVDKLWQTFHDQRG